MIIDTHCHFDMMESPEDYINSAENRGNIIIGMTNLPSHYRIGRNHINGYKNIRLALGLHPQLASETKNELILFDRLIDTTSYIGEIGLDFSSTYISSKGIQIECLQHILSEIEKNNNKIVSVHSQKAERQLLELLRKYHINNVIFHWYSGPVTLIKEIISYGYYFSINETMTRSENGKKIIDEIPKERILTESDAPYNRRGNIEAVLQYLNMKESEIYSNFKSLITKII